MAADSLTDGTSLSIPTAQNGEEKTIAYELAGDPDLQIRNQTGRVAFPSWTA
jgi:hypothetical protein